MAERLANLGYLAIGKETAKGTAVTPSIFLPLYSESITTDANFTDVSPIYGGKFKRYNVLQNIRSHKGDITVMAEPNTTGYLFDQLLTKLSTTGSSIYTHTFGFSTTANPNSYTYDFSTGEIVERYYGVEASGIEPTWNEAELQWKLSVSALGSFQGREIATVSTNTITLKTDYDPIPTKGLVASDLVKLVKTTGTTLDTSITTVNGDGITLVLGASAASFAAGDMIYLRPQTQALNLLPAFSWPHTEFRPGATAAASLSATQLRVEQGSSFKIMHNFENEAGSTRSGGFDPASLVRTTGDAELSIKRFFESVNGDTTTFNNLAKSAWTLRHFSGSTSQYEARVTFNHVKLVSGVVPDLKAAEIEYSELKYAPIYDTTDAQAIAVTVLNTIPTI